MLHVEFTYTRIFHSCIFSTVVPVCIFYNSGLAVLSAHILLPFFCFPISSLYFPTPGSPPHFLASFPILWNVWRRISSIVPYVQSPVVPAHQLRHFRHFTDNRYFLPTYLFSGYRCPDCNRSCASAIGLYNHRRTHRQRLQYTDNRSLLLTYLFPRANKLELTTSIVPWRNPDTRTIPTQTENVAVPFGLRAWFNCALVTVQRRDTSIALQVATAASAALYVTDRAGVQPVVRRLSLLPQTLACDGGPYAVVVCRLWSTSVIYVITWITTHLPTLKGWKAELVTWLVDP